MAVTHDAHVVGRAAGADLRTHQWKFVKLNASNQAILVAATTDRPFGILENAPNTGERADIRVFGIGKVIASATINPGEIIGSTNAGLAVTLAGGAVAPGVPYVGFCCGPTVAVNELVQIQLAPGFVG